jgi:hypothetical protein
VVAMTDARGIIGDMLMAHVHGSERPEVTEAYAHTVDARLRSALARVEDGQP